MIMPRGTHLDPNTIAALRESILTAKERDAAFEHLAVCGLCRRWLALNAELSDASAAPMVHAPRLLLWAKVAAAVLCVIAGSLLLSRHAPPGQSRVVDPVRVVRAAPASRIGRPAAIAHERLDVYASRRSSPGLTRALFRPIQFNPIANFGKPQAPGPWGRAKLTRQLNFRNGLLARNESQDASASLPALNQISIRTNMGERWITLTAFEATDWQSFR